MFHCVLWYKKEQGNEAVKKNLILILVLSAFVLSFFRCGEKPESGSVLSGTKKAASEDGIDIYYKISGVGNYTLVFVHEWCNDMTYWEHQIPAFSSGYKVLVLDLAGHGLSGAERKSWTMEAFGRDVASVIEKEGLKNVILIGHGMGGAVILETAGNIPDRVIGLVGVDTFKDYYMRSYSEEQVEFFIKPWREDFKKRMREYAVETFFHNDMDQEVMKRILLDMINAPPDSSLNMFEHLLRYDGSQAFRDIEVPIHCINSKMRDTSYDIADKNALSFDWIYQSGAGHFPMLENPDFFNRLLAGTLEDIILDLYKRQNK